MMRLLASLLALAVLTGPGRADHPSECLLAQHQLEFVYALPNVSRAIAAKNLTVLVIGAGSSTLPGANGPKRAYPARLQQALTEALPGVAVTVTTDIKFRRTAEDMSKALPGLLAAAKPSLVVWQTGTVDAMVASDIDLFSQALDRGIGAARKAGADVILINSQYSPRTESMIALSSYTEAMRWVALQQEIPLFNRFAIMRLWSDLGTFDFMAATKQLEIAERVHDCVGRLLADLVVESAKLGGSPLPAPRPTPR